MREHQSGAAEAFRTLRTRLRLLSQEGAWKHILVTSAAPEEGKTTTLANLGISMAQSGTRVLIVDADMRRPALHAVFQKSNARGLSSVLTEGTGIEAVIEDTGIENLSLVPAGPPPPNPSELLESGAMAQFMAHAGGKFDVVLYDSPPLAGLSDSVILSNVMDGVVQVIHGSKTPKEMAALGRDMLRNARARIIGAVLNNVNTQTGGYHYYHYSQRYYRQGSNGA